MSDHHKIPGTTPRPSTVHLLNADGTLICPEALTRDEMTDGEFWAHVYGTDGPDVEDFDPEEVPSNQLDPCEVCGEWGPCAYDSDWRPLIHLVPDEDSQVSAAETEEPT